MPSGPRAGTLNTFRKISASPPNTLLRVALELRKGRVPALVDTGAQFSCIRSDVIEYLYTRGGSCDFLPCSLTCLLADGRKAQVNNAAKLHVRLLAFSWDHEFKILDEGPFVAILGMDFLAHTQMRVDVASRTLFHFCAQ